MRRKKKLTTPETSRTLEGLERLKIAAESGEQLAGYRIVDERVLQTLFPWLRPEELRALQGDDNER